MTACLQALKFVCLGGSGCRGRGRNTHHRYHHRYTDPDNAHEHTKTPPHHPYSSIANSNVNVNAKLGSGIKLGYLVSVCGWASECEAKRTEAENASVRAIKILLGRGGTRRCRPADVSRRTTISTRPDNYGTARTDPGPSETSSEIRRRKRERT